MSSSTDPFVPQERKFGVTKSVLNAMVTSPPDVLILQTHSHQVVSHLDQIQLLDESCGLRVHISIETDRASIPGLPSHASAVADRFESAKRLKAAGIRVVVTVSPLMPIEDPDRFFDRIAECADAVVIDHFIEGDGSKGGQRTLKTGLPKAIREIYPEATSLVYRDKIVGIAERYLPGKVGVGIDGFGGRFGEGVQGVERTRRPSCARGRRRKSRSDRR
jgi:DNA repair photolyase